MLYDKSKAAKAQARETLRYQIAKEWRERSWSDSDMEAEIDRRLPRPAKAQPLFDFGATAKKTRRKALASRNDSDRCERRNLVLTEIAAAGERGLIRAEVADRLNLDINHITGPVSELLKRQRIYERGDTRLTRFGKPAAILRAALQD